MFVLCPLKNWIFICVSLKILVYSKTSFFSSLNNPRRHGKGKWWANVVEGMIPATTQLNQTTMEAQENDTVVGETGPSASHAPDGDDSLRQSSDVLARGLSSMLSAVITDFDCRANQTLRSQDHLSSVLDRLTGGFSLCFFIIFF